MSRSPAGRMWESSENAFTSYSIIYKNDQTNKGWVLEGNCEFLLPPRGFLRHSPQESDGPGEE